MKRPIDETTKKPTEDARASRRSWRRPSPLRPIDRAAEILLEALANPVDADESAPTKPKTRK